MLRRLRSHSDPMWPKNQWSVSEHPGKMGLAWQSLQAASRGKVAILLIEIFVPRSPGSRCGPRKQAPRSAVLLAAAPLASLTQDTEAR